MSVYATTTIVGTLGVDDVNTSKQARDVTRGLYEVYDDNHLAPMLAFSSATSKGRVAKNYKIEWHKKDLFPRWDTVATGAVAGTTASVLITNANYFAVGDSLDFPDAVYEANKSTKGYVYAKSTTTLTVHPVGETNLAEIVAGTRVHNMSNASEDYSSMPESKVVKDTNEYNYIQFMREPFKVGEIQEGMDQYTGSEEEERQKEKGRNIKMSWERQSIFGERDKKTGPSGETIFFMRGLKKQIEADAGNNILDWSGGLTQSQFNEWLIEGPAKFGSKKVLYCSSDLFNKIHDLWLAKEKTALETNVMGVDIMRYRAPGGKIISLVHHHMFEQSYEGCGILVDHMYSDLRPYSKNGAFQYHPNIQAPDIAGKANEWRIIASMEWGRSEPHGWIHV